MLATMFGRGMLGRVKAILFFLLLALGATISRAADDVVIARFGGVKVADLLELYARWAKREVIVPPEVAALKKPIDLTIEKKSYAEALKIVDEALATQAHVEVVAGPDGKLVARKIPRKN